MEVRANGFGVIKPLTEHVLFSPVDAGVQEILRQPGDPVTPREVIFLLDEIELDRNRVSLELEQLERQQTRLRAAFFSQLEAIELESAVLKLKVDQLRDDLAYGSFRSEVNGIVTGSIR